jgi:phage terminase large subunit-like protein
VRAIPKGPGAVCASALTASDSRSVQRAKVAEFLPADHRWLNRDGNGEARCIFPHGGYILFKSNDAGSRRFQGDAWDLFWADEEHDQAVYNEARMRLVDRGGRSLLTMTPLKGLTWVWARFLDKPEARTASYALHSEDNPHIPQAYLAALLASYGDHERAARSKGEFTTLEGRVYGGWARHLHLVEPFDVPEDWTRYGSIDFGTRNPFAYLHAAHDHSDDTIHITGMRYQAERTMSQHAEALRALWSRLGEPSWIVADPEDKGSRLALAREHGMATLKARKSIRPGISAVAERLALDAQGRPHLLIHNTPELAPLIREIEGYVWDAKNSKADQPDKPLKKDDHAMDALRYLCMQVARSAVFAVG